MDRLGRLKLLKQQVIVILLQRAAWLPGWPSRILQRSEELFQSFNLFVVRFQLHIFFERRRGSRTFAQFVIDKREIEVDEREPRLDLRCAFVVETRQGKLAGIVVEIPKIVMRLDVAWIAFER